MGGSLGGQGPSLLRGQTELLHALFIPCPLRMGVGGGGPASGCWGPPSLCPCTSASVSRESGLLALRKSGLLGLSLQEEAPWVGGSDLLPGARQGVAHGWVLRSGSVMHWEHQGA